MKLSEFKTEYSFQKWFYDKENNKKFPFIDFNLGELCDPVYIYRLTSKNDTIGLVIFSPMSDDEIYIDLFEIQEKYQRKGYGKLFFDMLMEKTNVRYVLLEYAGEESKAFWRAVGFHKHRTGYLDDYEMHKNIKKSRRKI